MENQTRFDLNQQLKRWRAAMLCREALDEDRVRELESHLKEAMVSLHTKGLSEEEAFWIATRRLGDGDALAAQFAQDDSATIWKYRVFWMAAGILIMNCFGGIFGLGLRLVMIPPQSPGTPRMIEVYQWLSAVLYVGGGLGLFLGLGTGKLTWLPKFMERFCAQNGRFAWKLAAVAMLVPVMSITFNLISLMEAASHGTAALAAFPWSLVLGQGIFPVMLAILAGLYAPVRRHRRGLTTIS